MTFPVAPPNYSIGEESRFREALRQADAQNLKRGVNLAFVAATVTFREHKAILTSANGTEYYLTVSNAGVLGTTAV